MPMGGLWQSPEREFVLRLVPRCWEPQQFGLDFVRLSGFSAVADA